MGTDMQGAVPQHQARFGPYLILRKLGEGAMAKVYLARRVDDRGAHDDIALKVLRREYAGKPEILSLLRREAVIGGRMRHPHVIATLEFGEIDGLPYLVMEYVQGVTVADLLEMVEGQGRGLPPELVASLMIQVCDGLGYAHALRDDGGQHLGVVHRALKPGNVLVSLSGVAKVMDFGVAKIKMYGGEITTVHRTTRGTPAYMSPEQARGDHHTHHSDIFTAGLLMYEALTGRKPFTAENFNELLKKVRSGELAYQADELEAIAPGMGRVFRRATAPVPLKRYPDARWMKEDIEQLYPADTPIPPPSMDESDPDIQVDRDFEVAPGVVPPPPLDVQDDTQPSILSAEDTQFEPAPLNDAPPDMGDDDEETLESPSQPSAQSAPPRAISLPRMGGGDDDDTTKYHVVGASKPSTAAPTGRKHVPSSRVPTPHDQVENKDETQYYTLGVGPSPDEEPTHVSKRPKLPPEPAEPAEEKSGTEYYTLGAPDPSARTPAVKDITAPSMQASGAGEDEVYYTLDGADPDAIETQDVAPPPRLLSPDEEDDIEDDEEIDLDTDTAAEIDLMDPDDIGVIGDIDLETLPELDLDDETIPEVDLGPPVFLELKPKPDPTVPVSTDTLVHLTQFLIEIDN